MKVLNSYKTEKVNEFSQKSFDEKPIVFSDKSTSYFDIVDHAM